MLVASDMIIGTQTKKEVKIMDKLILPVVKPLSPKEANTVRAVITDETLKELNRISDLTGIYISQLTRMCIEYALPRVEIKDNISN
jgi:hypothetical protein